MDPTRPTSSRPTHRRPLRAAILSVAALALLLAACEPEPTGPTTGPRDGSTAANAGTSCWGIKQQYPGRTSGIHWLYTPAMDRPAAFYCDMVTSGGGWVLIARGRDGWQFSPTGQGGAAAVRTHVSGSAAFAPAALDSATITGLTNGSSIAGLTDGIRMQRALNPAGTSMQEVRIHPRFTTWTWAWPAGQPLARVIIDGTTYQGSNTRDTFEAAMPGQTTNGLAGAQGTRRMFTWPWSANGSKAGFSFGNGGPVGSTSATSHLWRGTSTGYSLPFTRIWLRPRLANTLSPPAIPAGGYAAAPKPPGLRDRSELAPWGVVGMDRSGEELVEPWNTNVLTVEAAGPRVFVGGRFTGVRRGPTGPTTTQRSLAAFDLDGAWIDTFRPTLNGRVWDTAMTGDGKLIIAGDFTTVNGVARRGLAALDPTTGALIDGWRADLSRASGTAWRARTLEVRGSWVYVGGTFDRVTGGSATTPTTVSNAVSVRVSDGAIGTWRPTPNGSVVDLDVTDDGTRVLLAGFFATVGGSTTHGNFAITNLADGSPTAGTGTWTPASGSPDRYQQAVADLGDRLAVGGAQHSLQLWNRARTTRLDAAITRPGGDTQAIEVVGPKVYVACHCGGWIYLGTNDYARPSGFRALEPINLVGVWDAATWTYDTSWYPSSLKGASGEGIWDLSSDERGCLWVGGDLDRGAYSGNAATDWLSGFARFCPLDSTAPTAPGSMSVAASGTTRIVTWTAATDDVGVTGYDVIRDGRAIATVNGATRRFEDPGAPAGSRYVVRAFDQRGNRSASSAPRSA